MAERSTYTEKKKNRDFLGKSNKLENQKPSPGTMPTDPQAYFKGKAQN